MLSGNTYTQNFAGQGSDIVFLLGLTRVFLENENYNSNTGVFHEAMNTYGTIPSPTGLYGDDAPGAWKFSSYFYDEDNDDSIDANIRNESRRPLYYPRSIITIDGSIYVSISGTTFDNNGFMEFDPDTATSEQSSNGLLFKRCFGEVHFSTLTFQNYAGLDLTNLETILGDTEFAYIVTADPTQRDNTGTPESAATSPDYNIDYGFKSPLIKFFYYDTTSILEYNNYVSLTIAGLTLNNITYYHPSDTIPPVMLLQDDISSFSMTDLNIDGFELPKAGMGMFHFKTYGDITVQGGTIQNVNEVTFNYDTSEYAYVPASGSVFELNSLLDNTDYDASTSSFSDLTFDTIHAKCGGSIKMGVESDATTSFDSTVLISNITFQNSISIDCGHILSDGNNHDITISNCTFQDNHGINAEADLDYASSYALTVSDTIFQRFTSTVDNIYAQSISIYQRYPFANEVIFDSVTVKCSDTAFDADTYEELASDENNFELASPITMGPGNLKTISSTFSNCFSAKNGGVINADTHSYYTDEGSTFTENAAGFGAAILTARTQLSLTDTQLTYNYARAGGALTIDGTSTTEAFTGVTCSYNVATENGGCINLISSSYIEITDSTFSNNLAHETGSVIYALGTGQNTISDSTFSNNEAYEGNTFSFLFANSDLDNVTVKDNIAYAESAGAFMTFSTVSITDSTFTTTTYPDGVTDIEQAVDEYGFTSGFFMSVSAGSTLTVTASDFSNGYAASGGILYVSGNSDVTITDTQMTSGYSQVNGGAVYAASFKSLIISGCTLTSNVAYSTGSILYLSSGTTTISSSTLSAAPNYNAVNVQGGNFTGSSLTFTNADSSSSSIQENVQGGAIFISNTDSFSLSSCTFDTMDWAYQGGAVYMTMSSTSKGTEIPSSPSMTISSSNFTNNGATYGGALYVSGVDYVQVSDCEFEGNSAVQFEDLGGDGGAIYYSASDSISQIELDSTCTFNSNTAQISGGALFWNYIQPLNIDSVTYSSNTAELYGNDYACFAQVLKSITADQYNSAIGSSERRNLGDLSGSTSLTLSEQQSGGSIETIYLALVDEFDQIVGYDSSSTVTLAITGDHSDATYTPTITGSTTLTIENGVISFEGMTFTAEPGIEYSLSFTTTGIDSTLPSNEAYLADNSLESTSMEFTIALRSCVEGEAFLSTGACQQCASPDFYSLGTYSTVGD